MKYRTKLYLAFGSLLLGTIILVQGITYYESKEKFLMMIRSRVIGISTTAARTVNKDDVEAVKKSLDEKSEQFTALVQELRAIRDANRNNTFFVEYIYIIAPNPNNPDQIIVVADATEPDLKRKEYAPPGSFYPEGIQIGVLEHLDVPFAPQHIVSDRWEKFMPGYAPIFDNNGKYIATLAVNISADFLDKDLNRMLWISFTAMVIALGAGFIAATFLANGLTRSLNRIRSDVSSSGESGLNNETFGKDEFGELSRNIVTIEAEREEKDHLKFHFFRNVSKSVMDKLLLAGNMPVMAGEKRKITILSTDIRNFTHLTETHTPEEVVTLLNEYMTAMAEVVFANNGTIDKAIGDGLIILFGAPLGDLSQENRAVDTAIAMQQTLKRLNQKWEIEKRIQLSMVIGIHTDQGIVGNMGPESRKEYTAIGNAVNTSLRVRDAAKRLEVPILVSEKTWIPIRHREESKDLGLLYLKGQTNSVKIYSIELPKE